MLHIVPWERERDVDGICENIELIGFSMIWMFLFALRSTSLQRFSNMLGPLHPRDWEPVTITLQALSLAEKAEPV